MRRRRSVERWYLRISLRATVPGRYRVFFLGVAAVGNGHVSVRCTQPGLTQWDLGELQDGSYVLVAPPLFRLSGVARLCPALLFPPNDGLPALLFRPRGTAVPVRRPVCFCFVPAIAPRSRRLWSYSVVWRELWWVVQAMWSNCLTRRTSFWWWLGMRLDAFNGVQVDISFNECRQDIVSGSYRVVNAVRIMREGASWP